MHPPNSVNFLNCQRSKMNRILHGSRTYMPDLSPPNLKQERSAEEMTWWGECDRINSRIARENVSRSKKAPYLLYHSLP